MRPSFWGVSGSFQGREAPSSILMEPPQPYAKIYPDFFTPKNVLMTVGRTLYLPIHWHGWLFSWFSCRQIYHAWMVCVVGKTRYFWVTGSSRQDGNEGTFRGRPSWHGNLCDQALLITRRPGLWHKIWSSKSRAHGSPKGPIQEGWIIQSKEDGSSWYLYLYIYIYLYWFRINMIHIHQYYIP